MILSFINIGKSYLISLCVFKGVHGIIGLSNAKYIQLAHFINGVLLLVNSLLLASRS